MLFLRLGQPNPTQMANLVQLEHWIFPHDWPDVKNPSHPKSWHMQCNCHPIQVPNMFPHIGWSPRIPSHCLLKYCYPTDFMLFEPILFFLETYLSYPTGFFKFRHFYLVRWFSRLVWSRPRVHPLLSEAIEPCQERLPHSLTHECEDVRYDRCSSEPQSGYNVVS